MPGRIRKLLLSPIRLFRRVGWPARLAMLVPVGGLFAFGTVEMTSQNWFCNSCHIMNDYHASWRESSHNEVHCIECHLQPGLTGFMKGKINGLAQAVDCAVGRVGTKPNARVDDASCLREGCHSIEEIADESESFGTVKFDHASHFGQTVDGIPIACATCHSHFEGTEHFSVNAQACYSCHFLKSADSEQRVVQTTCLDCHEVPDKVVERGLVKVDHSEFVAYQASCEDSCHKKQVETVVEMEDTTCLPCHDFRLEEPVDSAELHAAHSYGHIKVECFACHGTVRHERAEHPSVAGMMDCQNCHSDTHNVQKAVFTAAAHPTDADKDALVLSPMFLTHVGCTDCHMESTATRTGALDSLGTVARATPQACDRCHEPGTGERYVPFWQKQVRGLHATITEQMQSLRERTEQMRQTPEKERMLQTLEEVAALLDSVEADGSWGVHNFKYSEAILLKARGLLNSIQP